jgi:hypothetical protein
MVSRINISKRLLIEPYVRDRVVHDFGAGDLGEAMMLLALGAHHIHAIDRHEMPEPPRAPWRVTRHVQHFSDWQHEGFIDVAFVSYPVNWDMGLARLLRQARTVIYHGKCTDGTMCGYEEMWRHLMQRQVLAHEHNPVGTLIIYGKEPAVRDPLPEEQCGVDLDRMWSYDEAYGSVRAS